MDLNTLMTFGPLVWKGIDNILGHGRLGRMERKRIKAEEQLTRVQASLTTARSTTEQAKADVQLAKEELTRANIEQKRIDTEVRQAGAAVARVKTNLAKTNAEQTHIEGIVRQSTAKLVEARKVEAQAAKKK